MENIIKFVKTGFVSLITIFGLAGCSGSVPKDGYSKYKDQTREYYKSIGGTGDEIRFNSCSYAYITGDGVLDAGNLKGAVYYCVYYTITIGGRSASFTSFPTYYSKTDILTDSTDSTAYFYAVSLIRDGSLKGETGTL